MKILFQGDSITDAGRDKRNYHDMGNGYPKYASEMIAAAFPDADIEFINLGISGNRTDQLFDRMHEDILQINPDIVSILICINDIWHRYSHNIATTDAQIEANYRAILERIKSQTDAKIMILSPFLLDDEEKLENDRYYLNNLRLLLDFKIFVRTFIKILKKEGLEKKAE